MFTNLFSKDIERIGFEDMQKIYKHPQQYILINTLPIQEQECLIYNTLSYNEEEQIINNLLQRYELGAKHIIVYGKNNCDNTAANK